MSAPRDTQLPSLIRSAAAGDPDALAQLMATYDGDMTRVCMVVSGDVTTARDAVAAAWPIAWRKLATLRDPDRLRSWLMSIAANQARQQMRAETRRHRYEGRITPQSPPEPGTRAEYLDLERALDRLAPDERRLIGLRYAAGLTSDEIAREVGGSGAAVRGRLARLLGRLREELDHA